MELINYANMTIYSALILAALILGAFLFFQILPLASSMPVP